MHSICLAMGSLPAVSFRNVCKVWDLLVILSVCIGFCCSRACSSAFDSSLVFVWLVFLCDLIYTTDAFARKSRQTCFSSIAAGISALFSDPSIVSTIQLSTSVPVILTFVPYHILVVLELDVSGVYMLLCTFRVAVLVKSGRVADRFAPYINKVRKKLKGELDHNGVNWRKGI